jgi:hypothetical protein
VSAPRLIVLVELERPVFAYLDALSESEELRIALDLVGRDLVQEILAGVAGVTGRLERRS